MATELTFKCVGAPAYGVSMRDYEATIDLSTLTATTVQVPLFVFPAGTTVLGAKAVFDEDVEGTSVDLAVDVGTYTITAAGAIGSASDADALFAAVPTVNKTAGTIVAAASASKGLQTTADLAVVAVPKAVTAAPTKGKLRICVATLY